MNDYVLYTDSACDLPDDLLARLGVRYRSLTFAFEGESEHADRDVPAKEFYAKMRAGGIAKTAAINTEGFREAFEEEIAAGHDILYIAFSSGLSTTYNSGTPACSAILRHASISSAESAASTTVSTTCGT